MKKLLTVFLAFVMICGMASGIAETVDTSEHLDIDIFAYFLMDVNPETDPVMRYLAEKFNVDFHVKLSSIDNYNDVLYTHVASGEDSDWFRITAEPIYRQLQEDGELLNVSKYVDKYGFKNIKAVLDSPNAHILATDGQFFRIPDSTGKMTTGLYYRKDWLDKLGISAPKTIEELTDAMRKAAAADPDGKGVIALTTDGIYYMNGLAPCFTGYNTWALDSEGNLINWYEDEKYKAFLSWLHDMYAEKLLDNELFTCSYENCMEKLATGHVAFYLEALNVTWFSINKNMLAANYPNAELSAVVPLPAGPSGSYARTDTGYYADSAFSAHMDENKAARCLAIMDYLLSDEGRDLTLYGYEEGKYYDLVDGKKVQKEATVNAEWGQTLHFMGELADFGTGDRLAHDKPVLDWYAYLNDPANCAIELTSYFYNEDSLPIQADIDEIVNRYVTGIVTGEYEVDAGWEEFQKALNNAGMPDLKKYMKEYFNKNNIELTVIK